MKLIPRLAKTAISGLLILALCLSTTLATAQSYDPDQELKPPTVFEKRVEKFGRGLGNILFGWVEIPVTMHKKMRQGKGLQYLLSTAPVMGTVRAFMRTGVGFYEVFTFPADSAENNYEPILEPEYLF